MISPVLHEQCRPVEAHLYISLVGKQKRGDQTYEHYRDECQERNEKSGPDVKSTGWETKSLLISPDSVFGLGWLFGRGLRLWNIHQKNQLIGYLC